MSDTTNQNQTTCPKCPEKFDTSFAMRKHHSEKHYRQTAGTIPACVVIPDIHKTMAPGNVGDTIPAGQTTEGEKAVAGLITQYGIANRNYARTNSERYLQTVTRLRDELESAIAREKHQYAAPHTIEVLEEVEPAIYAHRPNDCELTTEPEKNGCSCGATFLSGQKAKIKLVLDAAIKRERELMKEED